MPLSKSPSATALEVLAGDGVDVMLAEDDEYAPTPAVSLAILAHNRGRTTRLADGIVVTPPHSPPDNGGFKHNRPNGGPADTAANSWIEARANELLGRELRGIRRMSFERAMRLPTT